MTGAGRGKREVRCQRSEVRGQRLVKAARWREIKTILDN